MHRKSQYSSLWYSEPRRMGYIYWLDSNKASDRKGTSQLATENTQACLFLVLWSMVLWEGLLPWQGTIQTCHEEGCGLLACIHSKSELLLSLMELIFLLLRLLVFLVVFNKNSKGTISQMSVCILSPNPTEDITNTSAHTVDKLYRRSRQQHIPKGRTVWMCPFLPNCQLSSLLLAQWTQWDPILS